MFATGLSEQVSKDVRLAVDGFHATFTATGYHGVRYDMLLNGWVLGQVFVDFAEVEHVVLKWLDFRLFVANGVVIDSDGVRLVVVHQKIKLVGSSQAE